MEKITLPQFLSENYVGEWDRFAVSKMDKNVLRTSKEWYLGLCGLINLSKVKDKYIMMAPAVAVVAPKVDVPQTSIKIEEEVKNGVSEIVDNLKKNK